MKPQMLFSAIMSITGAFGVSSAAIVGFPSVNYAGHTIADHLADYGGSRYELGYASAIAFFLCLLMVATNLFIQKLIYKVGQ